MVLSDLVQANGNLSSLEDWGQLGGDLCEWVDYVHGKGPGIFENRKTSGQLECPAWPGLGQIQLQGG